MAEKEDIIRGSGNVFYDLGLPEPAEKKAKVKLAVALNDAISEKKLRQREVADLLRCTQPEVSALANYKLEAFSLSRLIGYLTEFDRDVEIGIRKVHGHGHIVVKDVASA